MVTNCKLNHFIGEKNCLNLFLTFHFPGNISLKQFKHFVLLVCSTLAELKHDPLEILELNNPENGIINVAGPDTIVRRS